jgi:hypothetical protein
MRTKVLLLHLLEGIDAGAVVSDLYDNFQVSPNPDSNFNPNLNPNLNTKIVLPQPGLRINAQNFCRKTL